VTILPDYSFTMPSSNVNLNAKLQAL